MKKEYLEMINENIKNEIDKLKQLYEDDIKYQKQEKRKNFESIISNLEAYNDDIYNIFETDDYDEQVKENERLTLKNKELLEILDEKLTNEEKLYYRISKGIEEF